ncbi:MAG: DEAD/DEAH box helicase [Planctomycetaceae bacterium]|nr:DEAD/DEAH box helicase [Planctomycetaceae bacterium]
MNSSSSLDPLPIDHALPSLVESLRSHAAVVLRAPPGAGKTTRVPPALLDIAGAGRIFMLEPRRLAARTAARRIAAEHGWSVGAEVGYQVRFDNRSSRATQIVAMTDGILLRRLQDDPFLEGVAVVIFDEFHERRLESDLALGMVRRVQQTVRPDLKIVVMSATLTPAPLVEFLGDCTVVESEGRMFPVDIRYAGSHDRRPLPVRMAAGIEDMLAKTSGDLLAFLPGVGEIHRTAREIEPLAKRHDLLVMPLFGDMDPESQDDVLRPQPRRKVVLATNVAETSVTIEGITGVVDCGLAKIMQFDPHVGLDRLELTPISKASAEQRAGRAGRLQPGACLRLWDEASQRSRRDYEQPDIRRVELSGAVLQLRCWGEADGRAFPWFEAPSEEQVAGAEMLLRRLGALDDSGVTETGRRMALLPIQPRLARLMIAGIEFGCAPRAALAAALLSERDPFRMPDQPQLATGAVRHASHSDIADRIAVLEEFERGGRGGSHAGQLQEAAARAVFRARDQLLRSLREEVPQEGEAPAEPLSLPAAGGVSARQAPRLPDSQTSSSVSSSDVALPRALLAAYPDRLARRRDATGPRGIMVGGRGVKLGPRSAVTRDELFLCIDVDDAGAEAVIRQASAVERDWLPPENLRTVVELFFHPSQRQVMARRRTYWEDLQLDETPTSLPDDDRAAELLFEHAQRDFARVFPTNDDAIGGFVTRVRCLAQWLPELELPLFDEVSLCQVLQQLCHGRASFAELQRAPWLGALQSALTYEQLRAVDREAPERIGVPSGSQIRLTYEAGRPPVLAVRIQEVFGLRESPRVARGRVPVLLHLLGPNMRPQQITDDLESFWANTYPKVRGELRRRYPKHSWPDDPLTAEPMRGAKRRPE